MAAVLMSWEDASTLAERFDVVRNWLAAHLPVRRRLGRTYQGFAKALLRHGPALIEQMAECLRQGSLHACGDWRLRHGFEPVAIDGSQIDAPRTIDNETHLGVAGRRGTHPQLAVTVAWHMGMGVPWTWRAGPAAEAERTHLRDMLDELPQRALLVMDAGFTGYDLILKILQSGRHALIRIGANVRLCGDAEVVRRGGRVWLRRSGTHEAIEMRLITVRRPDRVTMHLLTSVKDVARLSDADGARLYAMRWGVEVFYRQTKQTMERRKMRSANASRALMELHWTLIGVWLLMLLNASCLAGRGEDPLRTSTAAAARLVRQWMRSGRGTLGDLARALAQCVRDDRRGRTNKSSYNWPNKKRDKPPGTPRLSDLRPEQLTVITVLASEQ